MTANKALHRSTLVFRLFNVVRFGYLCWLFNVYSRRAACPVNLVVKRLKGRQGDAAMNKEQDPLRMKHTERGFWMYAAAYLCFGTGILMMVGDLVPWAVGGEPPDLAAGASVLLVAAFNFCILDNTPLKERIRELEQKTQADQPTDTLEATETE